jgi:hypothetical protein
MPRPPCDRTPEPLALARRRATLRRLGDQLPPDRPVLDPLRVLLAYVVQAQQAGRLRPPGHDAWGS